MGYKLEFTKGAAKELKNLPSQITKRVLKKLAFFLQTDNPLYFAKTITNSSLGDYRFRIGDYRVIIRIKKDTIYVVKIGHRKDIYE